MATLRKKRCGSINNYRYHILGFIHVLFFLKKKIRKGKKPIGMVRCGTVPCFFPLLPSNFLFNHDRTQYRYPYQVTGTNTGTINLH